MEEEVEAAGEGEEAAAPGMWRGHCSTFSSAVGWCDGFSIFRAFWGLPPAEATIEYVDGKPFSTC